jgi:ABC-type glycerol-3-phosphate transport system substrate-binding protein
MKRYFRWGLCFALLILFGACTTRQSAIPTHPAPDRIATIKIWLPEQDDDFYSRLAEKFEQENPGINLELKEIAKNDYTHQIDQAVREQSGPDIGMVTASYMLSYRFFLPLEETIAQYHVPVTELNKGAMAKVCIDGNRIYCLGTYTTGYVLFYNPVLLAEFGLSNPSITHPFSISDYLQLVKNFHPSRTGDATTIWGGSYPYPYLWSDRRSLFNADGRTTYRIANDEPTVNTYQILADLCRKNSTRCQTGEKDGLLESIGLFTSGKLATLITPTNLALPILENTPMSWGVTFVPTEKQADAHWVTTWTDGFGVLKTSSHPEEALRFIAYLGTRGNELRATRGDIPLNMRSAADWAGGSKTRQALLQVIQVAQKDVFVPDFAGTTRSLGQAFERISSGQVTAKDALDEVTPTMQKYLDQSWNNYDAISAQSQ